MAEYLPFPKSACTESTIIFPFDLLTQKYIFDFYFDALTSQALSKEDIQNIFQKINDTCSRAASKKAELPFYARLFVCGPCRYKVKKKLQRIYHQELAKTITVINKELVQKNYMITIPVPDHETEKFPSKLELVVLKDSQDSDPSGNSFGAHVDAAMIVSLRKLLDKEDKERDISYSLGDLDEQDISSIKKKPTRGKPFTFTDLDVRL